VLVKRATSLYIEGPSSLRRRIVSDMRAGRERDGAGTGRQRSGVERVDPLVKTRSAERAEDLRRARAGRR